MSLPPAPYRLWPAIAVTFITGLGFTSLKMTLITELGLAFDPAQIAQLPFAWMREVMTTCYEKGLVTEAISQGLAAVLTLGVFTGFLINSPLAGAWRAAPMFAWSCAVVAALAVGTILMNPWPLALLVGTAYGAACAARGKVIPLLAEGTGRHNTFVSGVINAALVVGLLAGTVAGMVLGQVFVGAIKEGVKVEAMVPMPWVAHALIAGIFLVGLPIALRVRTPACQVIPFADGMRHLQRDTWDTLRRHWALLVGGGLIWGVASAASLSVLIWGIQELGMKPAEAASIAVFAAIGAIIGNLVSDRMNRRSLVIASLLVLAGGMMGVKWLMVGYWSSAVSMIMVGASFAAPANVLDARLLHLTNEEGVPGRGSTVMSLIHNAFILVVGVGLAVPLFLGVIEAYGQFLILAGFTLAAVVVVLFAELRTTGGTTRVLKSVR